VNKPRETLEIFGKKARVSLPTGVFLMETPSQVHSLQNNIMNRTLLFLLTTALLPMTLPFIYARITRLANVLRS
jgi:hypothetical protein